MANIEDQKYFLQLLVYGNNHKQVSATLKEINDIQYTMLKNIANDVLDDIIPLNSEQYTILVQYKNFIRKLGRQKVSKTVLAKHLHAIKELAKLFINDHEVCKKTNVSSSRRMGKNKKTTTKNNSSSKCKSRTITSDEEYESDELWQKCYNKKEYETDNETEIETENEEETEGESEGEEEY